MDTIVVHYKEINKRVERDLEREREIQRREMEARKERLQELRMQREMEARRREGVDAERGTPPPSPPAPQLPPSPPPPPSSTSVVTQAEIVRRDDSEPSSSRLPNVSTNTYHFLHFDGLPVFLGASLSLSSFISVSALSLSLPHSLTLSLGGVTAGQKKSTSYVARRPKGIEGTWL